MMDFLKDKNIIVEGVEATGKTSLVKNLKRMYPFSIIQPSNYLEHSDELFSAYRTMSCMYSGLLFDRFFVSRSAIDKYSALTYMYNMDILSNENYLIFLNSDFDVIKSRMTDEKKGKFRYKSYTIDDIPDLATNMITIYDYCLNQFPDKCHYIDTSFINQYETLDKTLEFLSKRDKNGM